MIFAEPSALWALALLPVAAALLVILRRRRVRGAVALPTTSVLAAVRTPRRVRSILPPLLFACALVVLVAGVARPQTTERLQTRPGTVVLVIDVSASMDADDVAPTRLDAARAQAAAFVRRLPADMAVGLVTFASEVEVPVPPTTDHAPVLAAIAGLRAEGGTALGEAVSVAADLYAAQAPTDFTNGGVLLLADGRNSSGGVSPADAMASAAARGIPVYTIALGTPEGVLRYPNGEEQPVPPDPETLRRISQTTGALSFEAATQPELEQIYRDMSNRFVVDVARRQEITWVFALAAIPLLVLAIGLSLAMRGRFP